MWTVKWSELNCPKERTEVCVPGIGIVEILAGDVKRAEDWRDDPVFELVRHGPQPISGQISKYFKLGGIVGSGED